MPPVVYIDLLLTLFDLQHSSSITIWFLLAQQYPCSASSPNQLLFLPRCAHTTIDTDCVARLLCWVIPSLNNTDQEAQPTFSSSSPPNLNPCMLLRPHLRHFVISTHTPELLCVSINCSLVLSRTSLSTSQSLLAVNKPAGLCLHLASIVHLCLTRLCTHRFSYMSHREDTVFSATCNAVVCISDVHGEPVPPSMREPSAINKPCSPSNLLAPSSSTLVSMTISSVISLSRSRSCP